MLSAVLVFSIGGFQLAPVIARDAYGVPHIKADSVEDAFFQAGFAVAQDRLWQMEMSRRVARGQMAEVMGAPFAASDREVLLTGYTDEEVQSQIDRLSAPCRSIFRSYVRGVNAWIEEAKREGLPDGYKKYGFEPTPWTELDSAAIEIRLLQQFGRGGAGEIRNMALLSYMKGQAKLKGRIADVLDDVAWFNDPKATPTVPFDDDPVKIRPDFYFPDRKTTERHIASLPNVGLLELMQGIRVASRETSTRMAKSVSAPFETGSYCVVVSPKRSSTGKALLLSGPQMGFRTPSIVHEMSISTSGLNVVGMDVPGVPGVLIGYTPHLAWGLTSGVADTDDIVYYPMEGTSTYRFGPEAREFQSISRSIKIKGSSDKAVNQLRTCDGPVILRSVGTKTVFAKKTSYWMRELESFEAVQDLWHANEADDARRAIAKATMNFNFFYVTDKSEIGYVYAGLVPLRPRGVDPRFPSPGGNAYQWRGMIARDQMPWTANPKAGVLTNWNNKPSAWFPNGDTPVWGEIFRNSALLENLKKPLLDVQDLEAAAWTIARTDETWPYFAPYIRRALAKAPSSDFQSIRGFDGRLQDGSRQAATYIRFVDALRNELFAGTTGNFLSPEYFSLVIQPTVILNALRENTKVNYLQGRKVDDVVLAALRKADEGANAGGQPRRYRATGIAVPGQSPIPYSNRGTYIQVIEQLNDGMSGRNIVTPGVAESGPHSIDQVDLARSWLYKAMARPWLP